MKQKQGISKKKVEAFVDRQCNTSYLKAKPSLVYLINYYYILSAFSNTYLYNYNRNKKIDTPVYTLTS
jgi:hypothetical protein